MQAVATLSLVALTGVYVALTYKLASEAKQQRLDSATPIVVLSRVEAKQKPDEPFGVVAALELVLRNIGPGPALSMSIRLMLSGGFVHQFTWPTRDVALGPGETMERLELFFESDIAEVLARDGYRIELALFYRDVYARYCETNVSIRVPVHRWQEEDPTSISATMESQRVVPPSASPSSLWWEWEGDPRDSRELSRRQRLHLYLRRQWRRLIQRIKRPARSLNDK